ncbi:hypothetical protein MKK75_12870 [Methylobacterium sp. J-030]|uniref:hypothetical protein n=1 Tax=Methylobacterium sp. J-030 TaxID=2836627 RepID=UPI001FB92DDA|nr:hypothetical protein [Methylobacterium sp. J-030]MCJ2069670.1 hypothetical protein [Methylobacterium sp. J-030]
MTGTVLPFPLHSIALINDRTPYGVEVVLAPHGDGWAAWVRLASGRTVALEITDDRAHALADAEGYAARVGCSLTVRSTPAGGEPDRPTMRGLIYIWPNSAGGGSWGIEHESESGDSSSLLATAFSFNEAVTIARDAAQRLNATFNDPSSHFGGAA